MLGSFHKEPRQHSRIQRKRSSKNRICLGRAISVEILVFSWEHGFFVAGDLKGLRISGKKKNYREGTGRYIYKTSKWRNFFVVMIYIYIYIYMGQRSSRCKQFHREIQVLKITLLTLIGTQIPSGGPIYPEFPRICMTCQDVVAMLCRVLEFPSRYFSGPQIDLSEFSDNVGTMCAVGGSLCHLVEKEHYLGAVLQSIWKQRLKTSVHPPFNVPTKVDIIEIALGKAVVN